jgi:hypothetical protein
LADLIAGITAHFADALVSSGSDLSDTRQARCHCIRRVVALDPIIDATAGESSRIQYYSPVLQKAVDGLFVTLSGWRTIANHLGQLPDDQAKTEAAVILRCISPKLLSLLQQEDPVRWRRDPTGLRHTCESVARDLATLLAETPSQRLLADKAAEVLMGVSDALAGQVLLAAGSVRPVPPGRGVFQLRVADWLPALVNAGRAFLTIGALAAFWIVSSWPNGAVTIVWAAIVVILFSPRADQAYQTAMGTVVGVVIAAMFAASLAFAVLPRVETFAGFAIVLGLYMIPAGTLAALPGQRTLFGSMSAWFMFLLEPTNPMIRSSSTTRHRRSSPESSPEHCRFV